eukprot:351479-Chlamydomonas_euryale.AAC.26
MEQAPGLELPARQFEPRQTHRARPPHFRIRNTAIPPRSWAARACAAPPHRSARSTRTPCRATARDAPVGMPPPPPPTTTRRMPPSRPRPWPLAPLLLPLLLLVAPAAAAEAAPPASDGGWCSAQRSGSLPGVSGDVYKCASVPPFLVSYLFSPVRVEIQCPTSRVREGRQGGWAPSASTQVLGCVERARREERRMACHEHACGGWPCHAYIQGQHIQRAHASAHGCSH